MTGQSYTMNCDGGAGARDTVTCTGGDNALVGHRLTGANISAVSYRMALFETGFFGLMGWAVLSLAAAVALLAWMPDC